MSTLLSVNSYFYRRDGAGTIYMAHNNLFAHRGWMVVPFAMRHPENLESSWSKYFVSEIEFGRKYSLPEQVARIPKVVYSLEARRKLRDLLRCVHPDIAHCHTIYHHLSPSILGLLRAAGIPTVMTLHDLKLACPAYMMFQKSNVCEKCRSGRLHNVVVNRCIKSSFSLSVLVLAESVLHNVLKSYDDNVDIFVSPSAFYIEKHASWGWSRERFVHVPNFVDARSVEPQFAPGKAFIYLGRLSPEKGLLTLVRAAARARVPVRIVGNGPQLAELQAEVTRLRSDVTFLGRMSGKELQDQIRAARATVLPSEWYENAPMSILESYALGKPVIAANIGGIPEMLPDRSTGWMFETKSVDQLARTLRDVTDMPDADVAEFGRNARRLAESEFSPEIYAERIKQVYSSVSSRLH